jgi:hypothetical protein
LPEPDAIRGEVVQLPDRLLRDIVLPCDSPEGVAGADAVGSSDGCGCFARRQSQALSRLDPARLHTGIGGRQ